MKKLFILLILFSAFSCKSIKKVKSIETSMAMKAQEETYMEMELEEEALLYESYALEAQQKLEYTEEEQSVTESFTPITTNTGEVKIVPIKTTVTKKITYKSDDSSNIDSQINQESFIDLSYEDEFNKKENSKSELDFNLDKQSESSDIIEELASGIFGSWSKIIVPVLIALFTAGWKIYQEKRKK